MVRPQQLLGQGSDLEVGVGKEVGPGVMEEEMEVEKVGVVVAVEDWVVVGVGLGEVGMEVVVAIVVGVILAVEVILVEVGLQEAGHSQEVAEAQLVRKVVGLAEMQAEEAVVGVVQAVGGVGMDSEGLMAADLWALVEGSQEGEELD